METIESFAARARRALASPTFEPTATLRVVVVADVPAGHAFDADISGTLLIRRGETMLFTDGYPAGQDDDGFDVGFAAARLLVLPADHGHAQQLLELIGEGRVSTLEGVEL